MYPSEIPIDSYTNLHFGFGSISETFDIKMSDSLSDQWDSFKDLAGPKLILSLGGWAFSTEPETYAILREAVNEDNRATFAKNLATFISDSGIDGVDIDWEYPGAPDIPGTLSVLGWSSILLTLLSFFSRHSSR
jgi:chitinase